MRSTKYLSLTLIALILLLGLNTAQAAQIPWQNPSGNTNDFTFDNGGTSDQLFVPAGTSPVVTPTGLAFFPSAFKAQASGGVITPQNQVSDKLSFDIHVKAGKQLSGFTINEFGDYTIQGVGLNTGVKAFGSVFLTNLDTFEVRSASLTTTPAALGVGDGLSVGQGNWSGFEAINSIPAGWRNIRVELDNILQARSDVGTNAFIEKKIVTPGVEINVIIPEPASASLAVIASALLFARRRPRA